MKTFPWERNLFASSEHMSRVRDVDPAQLTGAEFEVIERTGQPVRFLSAVAQWPALTRWPEAGYLPRLLGPDIFVDVRCEPDVESFGLRPEDGEARAVAEGCAGDLGTMPFPDFLSALETPSPEYLATVLQSHQDGADLLKQDMDALPFFPTERTQPSTVYPPWAVMFGRRTWSDWHLHPLTESLICQLVGIKIVLLLPPDQPTWDVLHPVHVDALRCWDVDLDRYPDFAHLSPLRAVLQPGDALYVPAHWWHSVRSVGEDMTATAIHWWQAGEVDPEQPASRAFADRAPRLPVQRRYTRTGPRTPTPTRG